MYPEFHKPEFLNEHIHSILRFYAPNVEAPGGGFYQNFADDGSVYDTATRHLVSSTRFIFNYARAYLAYENPDYLRKVQSGIYFLREQHYQPDTRGYAWVLKVKDGHTQIIDATNHCYGLAFVMLAYSWAFRCGIKEAQVWLADTWQLMEEHFWEPAHGLYADEACADFSQLSPYRGQNANMHTCEALIAAFEATSEHRYLTRALTIADHITNRQAALADGRIWEHYTNDWQPDWQYNKQDPKNLFRPWGFQPGHHTEWAKLLLQLYQYSDVSWLVERAKTLFDTCLPLTWDDKHGGIFYGFAPDNSICDDEKYFWVQAESLACAARLALVTNDNSYWQWYHRIWQYAWDNLIDHQYGAWYRILSQDNQKLETTKSPVGKTDYHTMGACYDVLDALNRYVA